MKKIIATLGILALGTSLGGCTKKDPNDGQLIPPGQILRLEVWTAQEPGFIEALGREFVSVSKTPGIAVNVINFGSEENLHRYLNNEMAEGTGPDIIFTSGEWIAQNTKKLLPRENDVTFTAPLFSSTFVRAATETLISNGLVYGVPVAVDSLAIIYNQEHLIDRLENRNVPATNWKDFKTDVELLTKPDMSPTRFEVSGAALGRFDNINYGYEILEDLMLQMGTSFFSSDGKLATFASTQGILPAGEIQNFGAEAFRFFTSFASPAYKNFSWGEYSSTEGTPGRDLEAFASGRVSMVFGFSRDIKRIKDIIAIKKTSPLDKSISENNIQVAPFPNMGTNEIEGEVLAFAVPRTTKNPEIAWKFLKFAIGKDTLKSFHDLTGLPTPRLDLISEQVAEPLLGVFVRQAKFARALLFPIPRSDLKEFFTKEISAINDGKISPDQALAELEKQVNARLRSDLSRQDKIEKVRGKPKATTATDTATPAQ